MFEGSPTEHREDGNNKTSDVIRNRADFGRLDPDSGIGKVTKMTHKKGRHVLFGELPGSLLGAGGLSFMEPREKYRYMTILDQKLKIKIFSTFILYFFYSKLKDLNVYILGVGQNVDIYSSKRLWKLSVTKIGLSFSRSILSP